MRSTCGPQCRKLANEVLAFECICPTDDLKMLGFCTSASAVISNSDKVCVTIF